MRLRQSRLRAAARFFASDFSITLLDGPHVKARLERDVKQEGWRVTKSTGVLAVLTAGISLGLELPLRDHWMRNKLFRLHESPALAAVEHMASPTCSLRGLVSCLTPLLSKLPPEDTVAVLEFDFARAAALVGSVSETDFDKILLLGEFVVAAVRAATPLTEELVCKRVRELVQQAAQGKFVIVAERGDELIELKRANEGNMWVVRAIEKVFVEEQVVRELARSSETKTHELLSLSSPVTDMATNLVDISRKVDKVIRIHEHETVMKVQKSETKTKWKRVRNISAFDAELGAVTCRLIVLLANHANPAYLPVRENPAFPNNLNASCFRTSDDPVGLVADMAVSVEEMKLTPLPKTSTYLGGMVVTHPEGTTVVQVNPLALTWGKNFHRKNV